MIEYKMYNYPNMKKIMDYLESKGEPKPNEVLSVAFTAEEDGEIKALIMVQSIPLCEPAHAEEGFGEHLHHLFETAKEFIWSSKATRVIMHTSNRAMEVMLKRSGARPILDVFYDWRRDTQ